MTRGKSKLRAMLGDDTTAEHMGDIVLPEFAGVRIERSELQRLFDEAGLPAQLVDDELTPQAALGKAVSRFRDGGGSYFTKRNKKRGREVLVVRQVGRSFKTMAVVSVDDAGAMTTVPGPDSADPNTLDAETEDKCKKLRQDFEWHMAFADSGEVGDICVSVLIGYCGGIRLKERGHAYWVPAASAEIVRALDAVVASLGTCDLGRVPVTASNRGKATVQRMAIASFEADLQKLNAQLDAFRESEKETRASSVERRLDAFADLRSKCAFYADILDKEKTGMLRRLKKAEKAAQEFLTELEEDDDDSAEELFDAAT